MKDLEVKLRLYNNRLKQRREELGLTQVQMSKAAGISYGTYNKLEGLRISPINEKTKKWRSPALKLADFFGESVEEIFPISARVVQESVGVIKVNSKDLFPILSDSSRFALLSPDEIIMERERLNEVNKVLSRLTPMQEMLLKDKFGICGGSEMTYEEVAKKYGFKVSRARQGVEQALRNLKHPKLGKRLRELNKA